jgi:hypothetical protein
MGKCLGPYISAADMLKIFGIIPQKVMNFD